MAKPTKSIKIEEYKGIEIYSRNAVQITLDPKTYKHFIDLKGETNIALSQLILLQIRPCQKCGCENYCLPKMNVRVKKEY